MKIKMFTDSDLDGLGCYTLIEHYKDKSDELSAEFTVAQKVSKKISEFIRTKSYEDYDLILVTDLALDDNIVHDIMEVINTSKARFIIVDHHKQTISLKNNHKELSDSIYVSIDNDPDTTFTNCASSLLLYNINNIFNRQIDIDDNVKNIIELIRLWDIWLWDGSPKEDEVKELKTFFKLYGGKRVGKNILKAFECGTPVIINEFDKKLIKFELNREREYIYNRCNNVKFIVRDGITIGYVFAEKCPSEIGSKLLQTYSPERMQVAAIINMNFNVVSLRSDNRRNVDVGDIAAKYGGGGHKYASGFKIKNSIIKDIFTTYVV